jgi:hypothetical protein
MSEALFTMLRADAESETLNQFHTRMAMSSHTWKLSKASPRSFEKTTQKTSIINSGLTIDQAIPSTELL